MPLICQSNLLFLRGRTAKNGLSKNKFIVSIFLPFVTYSCFTIERSFGISVLSRECSFFSETVVMKGRKRKSVFLGRNVHLVRKPTPEIIKGLDIWQRSHENDGKPRRSLNIPSIKYVFNLRLMGW
jgi:hypothetical protein